MTKLDFEYDESSGFPAVSVAEYRGLTIKAVQDTDASNPWRDSDGLAPLLWTSGDGLQDETGRYDIESVLAKPEFFSDYALGRKWNDICRALGEDAAALDSEVKQEQKDYGGRLADFRRDRLESILSDMRPSERGRAWSAAVDYFDALQRLWTLAGVAALDFQRSGYSQGDSVVGLLVALPAWREAMGIPANHDMQADLERQADLFGSWAFGDVFGFVIEDEPDGETLDSCWGFYGSDYEESGLADAARESADYILKAAAKRKADKLKELIRNRVPLHNRPAILAEAGALAHVC